jgi:hypothetical protein
MSLSSNSLEVKYSGNIPYQSHIMMSALVSKTRYSLDLYSNLYNHRKAKAAKRQM